ncbi:hypothetical protein C9994_08325 [Marivirga lumbricoides]|uniref:Methyltransferase type 11 n=1 Tax=Marivirga lumbricoides TaxID=1046115 RepID=A0A2T4DR09_9BACT|nr:hypothetical protein C9994_08325 [Marivirga lumbricoides]
MVEVFKTNISRNHQAERMVILLRKAFPVYQVNFDLEDCDKILRVKTRNIAVDPDNIIQIFTDYGFKCEVLADTVHEV